MYPNLDNDKQNAQDGAPVQVTTPAQQPRMAEAINDNIRKSVERTDMIRRGVLDPNALQEQASLADEQLNAQRDHSAHRAAEKIASAQGTPREHAAAIGELQDAYETLVREAGVAFKEFDQRITDLDREIIILKKRLAKPVADGHPIWDFSPEDAEKPIGEI